MDKRTEKTLRVIKKLARKYGVKRRVRNYPFITGLIFELFQSRWPVMESKEYVDILTSVYSDWNEFRHTPLKYIQEDLDISVRDIKFVAQLKKYLETIYSVWFSFKQEVFLDLEATECLSALSRQGLPKEITACAICTYLGKPILPLTDPVLRCIKRLDIFPSKASRKRIRTFFRKRGEEGLLDVYQAYRLFEEHSAALCFIKEPDCNACFLSRKECRGDE
jgi:hypothetical protein